MQSADKVTYTIKISVIAKNRKEAQTGHLRLKTDSF